jgi:hypothetical protein
MLAQPHKGYWFWLKGIAGWDLMLAQPHKGYWFWLKGISGWDLRLVQPHRFWFWLKGIAGWDLRLAQPQRFFVLVKGDRKMGSQVSPITQRILALVKTKFEKKRKKKERI